MEDRTVAFARDVPGHRTYADTVARGLYGRQTGGLRGKYDNVRTYWEDRLTRMTIAPFVTARDRHAMREGRKVRVVDLGCGAGQGYELLTRIDQEGLTLGDAMRFVLPPSRVGLYCGIDLSPAMVEQGRANYGSIGGVHFMQGDLRDGLRPVVAEPPFDIYFSSYGSLSHLEAPDLRRCLVDVVEHAGPGSIVVLDLIGRYSPEWPGYWHAATEDEKVRPYSMSYLFSEVERESGDVETFPLRFWTGDEIVQLCHELSPLTAVSVTPVAIVDRSVFVGRHLDTREYGTSLPPLRSLVNRLYEQNVRTRLEDLRVLEPQPLSHNTDVDRFLATLSACWNRVIDFTLERLRGRRISLVTLDGWRDFPPPLQVALMTMDRVVDSVSWIDVGDSRANIIEPQLAYVLQRLEHSLQRGLGCGHALLVVLSVGGAPTAEA
jgi:SAM-dependent methyltransferase